MCGRFTLRSNAHAVADAFGILADFDLSPRYNISPTQHVAVVRATDGVRNLSMLRWGLVPFWAKDPSIGNKMINARVETVAEKPAYKQAFANRRCLIPADGYYEWQNVGKGKQPYLFHMPGDELFAFAGLWEKCGEWETFTLITQAASERLAEYHDRMPVIMPRGHWAEWLAKPHGSLLGPSESKRLEVTTVSTKVNNPKHDGPDCAEPV